MSGSRRRYTAEFKAEAVRLVVTSGKPVAQIARELGVNEQTLHNWKKQATTTEDGGVTPDVFAVQEENRRLRRELARVTEERNILKKSDGVLCERIEVRFGFMRRHEDEFRITSMCRVLRVTRAGYYAWRRRTPSVRSRSDQDLLTEIRSLFDHSRGSYGSPRIYRSLRREGHRVSEKRVARLMAQAGLRAKRSKRFRVTTDSRHTKTVHENVLARDFAVGTPNRAWGGDITYVWTGEGWLYLAVVMDLGTRRVIGWSLRDTLRTELVTSALDMALGVRVPHPGLICHSDRGSQYGADDVTAMIDRYHMRGSMSRKGNCWDNAVVESFFGTFKTERVHGTYWQTRAEAKSVIVQWIEGWYNRERMHTSLDDLSPVEFEERLLVESI